MISIRKPPTNFNKMIALSLITLSGFYCCQLVFAVKLLIVITYEQKKKLKALNDW